MARVLCLLILFAFVKGEDDCVCNDYTAEEKKEIWEFLKKFTGTTEEDAVLPALLSPLVPCGNCIDSVRKKRTILPAVTDRDENVPILKSDPRCPVGYSRIGFRCVNVEALYE